MNRGDHVRLVKMGVNDPARETVWEPGYWSKGHLSEDIRVGRPIHMWRYARAAQTEDEPAEIECAGVFTSTPVTHIRGDLVQTINSTWKVEQLPPISV